MKTTLALVMALLFVGCSEDKPSQVEEKLTKSIEKVQKEVKKEKETVVKAVKEESKVVTNKSSASVKKEVSEKIHIPKAKKAVIPKKVVAKKPLVDGSAVYAKCSSCHGVNADKKALNKSQSIKGWSVAKLTDAINGYKDGTYGGSMKGVMKPQVNKLSSDEVQAVSEYISKLK